MCAQATEPRIPRALASKALEADQPRYPINQQHQHLLVSSRRDMSGPLNDGLRCMTWVSASRADEHFCVCFAACKYKCITLLVPECDAGIWQAAGPCPPRHTGPSTGCCARGIDRAHACADLQTCPAPPQAADKAKRKAAEGKAAAGAEAEKDTALTPKDVSAGSRLPVFQAITAAPDGGRAASPGLQSLVSAPEAATCLASLQARNQALALSKAGIEQAALAVVWPQHAPAHRPEQVASDTLCKHHYAVVQTAHAYSWDVLQHICMLAAWR